MHHRILAHIVWTTRDRAPSIDLRRARYLAEHLPIIIRQERGNLLALGIVATHVHLLVRLHPVTNLPRLMQRLKGSTAHAINATIERGPNQLRWAKGYSVTSVSPREIAKAFSYVRSQHQRQPALAIPDWPGIQAEAGPSVASATPAEPSL